MAHGSDSHDLRSPAQMAQVAEDISYSRATGRPLKSFLLGLTAGAYIAVGFVFFITTKAGAGDVPWGISQLIGDVVFSTGLILVVLTGAELFTGSTLTLTARASGRITWSQLLKNWGIVYVANFLGALVIVGLIYLAGTWRSADGEWGAVVLTTSLAKVDHPFLEAFALGVLCNLMVCLGIWAAYSGRTTTDKILAVILPIALFVATGFEHSVANMFMIPLGLLLKDTVGAEFWSTTGLAQADFADLTWGAFLVDNLLPVTLGNIVGGGLMVGIMYWTIFRYLDRPRQEPERGGKGVASGAGY